MATQLRDVLSANLVLLGVDLLNVPDEVEQFRQELDVDIRFEAGLATDMQSGMTEPSRTLTLDRDRIALNLHSSRSSIGRQLPEKGDLSRLAKVASLAIDHSSSIANGVQAFGYNFEMVFEQDSGYSAIRYLGDRLFTGNALGEESWGLFGGTGRLIFDNATERRMLAIEPRYGSDATTRVFLNFNLHKNEARTPSEEEIKDSLERAWLEACAFMERLDQQGVA